MSIRADWAHYSKLNGTSDDYQVLTSSAGPIEARHFASVLEQWAPGNPPPPSSADHAGRLPWTTLSHFWMEDELFIGLALYDWSDRSDGAGRPVLDSSYFAVRYDTADDPWSYSALRQAVEGVTLPLHPDEPFAGRDGLQLNPTPYDPRNMARLVTRYGFARVATAAAAVLAGDLAITHADRVDHATRLEFLDAVTALLPCGVRPYLSASTWGGSGHRMRVAFSQFAREGAHEFDWARPRPAMASPAAAAYLEVLTAATDGGADLDQLTQVVTALAEDRAVRDFTAADATIATIGRTLRGATSPAAGDAAAIASPAFPRTTGPARDTRRGQVDASDTILTRTHAEAVAAVIEAMMEGKAVALAGGGKTIEDIAKAAKALRNGQGTSHPELSRFRSWDEVLDAAANDPAAESLRRFARLVERFTPDGLLRAAADLVTEPSLDPNAHPDVVVLVERPDELNETPNYAGLSGQGEGSV
jgi:hypothetical protein